MDPGDSGLNLQESANIEMWDPNLGRDAPDVCHYAGHMTDELTVGAEVEDGPLELLVCYPAFRWLESPIRDPAAHLVVRCFQ